MRYPIMDYVATSKDMVTNFQGLDAKLTSCTEGEFFDMRNITTQYYPVLSPRNRRGFVRNFTNLQGILDKESLIWIDNGHMYVDGVDKLSGISAGQKTIAKMGAYVVIMPDKIWYNCDDNTHGNMDATISTTASVTFTPCKADGSSMGTIHDEAYYKTNKPTSGSIMRTYTQDGKASFKIYSELTSLWSAITSTYFSIAINGQNFSQFKDLDGVKISINTNGVTWAYADKVFVNDEGNGWRSINGCIQRKNGNSIVIVGLMDDVTTKNLQIKVERKTPNLKYITECQNRLWGCSEDGHEIYCCKLGDVTNWNYFSGTAIDSYAATVGSDGVFTGAVTYNNNPIFFKEHSFLKVTVSATGAHSYREQPDRGVQNGSSRSICNVNGVLFYKGVNDVYAFDGSSPMGVGENLGEHRYFDAVSGTINGRYYMSVKDADDKYTLFVYDTTKGIWAKEDEANVTAFCTNKDDLLFVVGNKLFCVDGNKGTVEAPIAWYTESGYIGFSIAGKKYVSKINIRMSLDIGAYCDLWIQYDNEDKWKHIFNMSGKGTKSFTVPVTIQRCDHFRIKLSGKGGCKIYSISKTIEEGSDV